jgi:serine/threonine protein phosphatase 1
MSTLAIGDIHGNLPALSNLLGRVRGEIGRGDTVVFLGDYIDRGPGSRGCIDAILDLRERTDAGVVCLLGNHEDWMLRTLEDHTKHSWLFGMDGLVTVRSYSDGAADRIREACRNAGMDLFLGTVALPYELFFEAMPTTHRAFLTSLQLSCSTEDCYCSHAGLDPDQPMHLQTADALIWGSARFPESYSGVMPVVYGHWNDAVIDSNGWPAPRVRVNTIGVDTSRHGVVTAVRMPERQVLQSDRYPI